MSTIGFSPKPETETEQLRTIYAFLNDVQRNLNSVAKCLKSEDLRLADAHVRAAEWHASQAKEKIATLGQSKIENKPLKRPVSQITI